MELGCIIKNYVDAMNVEDNRFNGMLEHDMDIHPS